MFVLRPSNNRHEGVRIVIQGPNAAALCNGCADLVVEAMAERRDPDVVEIVKGRKPVAVIEVNVLRPRRRLRAFLLGRARSLD